MFRSLRTGLNRVNPARPIISPRLSLFTRSLHTRVVPECKYFTPEKVRYDFLRELAARGDIALADLPYMAKIPEDSKKTAVVGSDGAATSGDPGGKGTKVAMSNGCFDLLRARNITWDKALYQAILHGIDAYMGSGKLFHFQNICQDMGHANPELAARYSYLDTKKQKVFLLEDAHWLVGKLRTDGVKAIEQYSVPVPGFKEFAEYLKKMGITLALQSAYSAAEVAAFNKPMLQGGVEFAVSISSSDVRNSRPAPDMLLLLCEKLKVLPHQVLALGDTPFDMRAALLAGCIPVGVPNFSALLPSHFDKMPPQELNDARNLVARTLVQNGAAYVLYDNSPVIRPLKDMMAEVITHHNMRLMLGENPYISPKAALVQSLRIP